MKIEIPSGKVTERTLPPDCPKALKSLVLGCMNPNPDKRPDCQTILDLLKGINIAQNNPSHVQPEAVKTGKIIFQVTGADIDEDEKVTKRGHQLAA